MRHVKTCQSCKTPVRQLPPNVRHASGPDEIQGLYFECSTPACGNTLFLPYQSDRAPGLLVSVSQYDEYRARALSWPDLVRIAVGAHPAKGFSFDVHVVLVTDAGAPFAGRVWLRCGLNNRPDVVAKHYHPDD